MKIKSLDQMAESNMIGSLNKKITIEARADK